MALESEESFSGGSRSGRSSARSSRSNSRRQSPERRDRSVHEATLRPLPVSLTFDMRLAFLSDIFTFHINDIFVSRNVLAMTDIKTHIGYARAWVRLALEKKLLSKHLRTLLMDTSLLKYRICLNASVKLLIFIVCSGLCTNDTHSCVVMTRRSNSCTIC
jgi:RUN domain